MSEKPAASARLRFGSIRFSIRIESHVATCNLPFNQCATNQLATRCAGAPPLPPSSPATWLKSTIPSQLARNSLGSTFGLTIGSCCCCCLCWLTVLSAGQISVKCAHVWVCASMCMCVCVCIGSICAPWMTNCAQGGFLFFSWFARFGLVFSWSTSRRRRVA